MTIDEYIAAVEYGNPKIEPDIIANRCTYCHTGGAFFEEVARRAEFNQIIGRTILRRQS